MNTKTLERWTIQQARELYSVENWGCGHFDIAEQGEASVRLQNKHGPVNISLMEVIAGLKERGLSLPVLLRFPDILDSTISRLNESFAGAIQDTGYQGVYRGVYPIKVNQQAQVVEEIAAFGKRYHHGFEAGSKAELLIALAYLQDQDSYVVCNGYKDAEFVDLAFHGQKMGVQVILVVEMLSELNLILERAQRMGIKPRLGIRLKLSAKVPGKWNESSGDRSVFGMTMAETIRAVDILRDANMLDCLEMVHYHLGSQVPNIGSIRTSVTEAVRVYLDLLREGAKMGILDIGGGLAVDYDGSNTNFASSRNYDVKEYCTDVIETVMEACDDAGVAHPTIVSESGRFLVTYSSVLVFNILDAGRWDAAEDVSEELPEKASQPLLDLEEVLTSITQKNLQECLNDAVFLRDQIRSNFVLGHASLRERAVGESLFGRIITRIAKEGSGLRYVPEDIAGLQDALSDVYYANFSVFQSLPDSWAIGQLFPVLPLHRLNEAPKRKATIADITCDCDGKIDTFIDLHDVKKTLPVHELKDDEDYVLGVFLVGAYQETLGDLHNLFGDTNIVSISVDDDGNIDYANEVRGDSVSDVLSYVEYDPKDLVAMVRHRAEQAVRAKRISTGERREILESYSAGIQGYTYFEDA